MGVDARCYLPPDTQVDDVAKVLSRLANLGGGLVPLSWGTPYQQHEVKVETTSIPEMARLVFTDSVGQREFYYHFENYIRPLGACRSISARSRPSTCGYFRELAKFFGGGVEYSDCTGEITWFDRPRGMNCPEDGAAWQAFQNEIAAVLPASPLPEVAAYEE